MYGADEVNDFDGFKWFDEHFQKTIHAKFDHGYQPEIQESSIHGLSNPHISTTVIPRFNSGSAIA